MRRLFLMAALPLALMACGSDNNTPTIVSLAGTWNLSTANGTALPFTISPGPPKIELLSASVVVGATGAFTGTEQIRTTVNGTATTTTSNLAGTITASGTLVTVVITGSGTVTGTLTGTTQFSYVDP